MRTKTSWIGFALAITVSCGCGMEGAEHEPLESSVLSATQSTPPIDSFVVNWTKGTWVQHFPVFPRARVAVGGLTTSGLFGNGHEFPIAVNGYFAYGCADDRPAGGGNGLIDVGSRLVDPAAAGFIVQPSGTANVPFPDCGGWNPVWTGGRFFFRPIAPEGAVAFHDAFAQVGDGYNFFPSNQMRLSAGFPIARSEPLDVGDSPTHKLSVRYAHGHPDRPAALIKVSIQNLDAAGATVQAFNQVEFPTTPVTNDYDQWQVVSVSVKTPGSVTHVYARLQLQTADVVYLDAVWVSR